MKFIWGLAAGTALAMLFAPARGEETRRDLANRVRETAESQKEKLREKAGEIGARVGRQAAESAVAAVTNKVIPRREPRTAQ